MALASFRPWTYSSPLHIPFRMRSAIRTLGRFWSPSYLPGAGNSPGQCKSTRSMYPTDSASRQANTSATTPSNASDSALLPSTWVGHSHGLVFSSRYSFTGGWATFVVMKRRSRVSFPSIMFLATTSRTWGSVPYMWAVSMQVYPASSAADTVRHATSGTRTPSSLKKAVPTPIIGILTPLERVVHVGELGSQSARVKHALQARWAAMEAAIAVAPTPTPAQNPSLDCITAQRAIATTS
mmetsp:Transcript_66305/g.209596  ORF Transcript_66305/g.209596 Transcript_66305/m.209596 type:complete len:239 (+) Transcript_66305:1096-1812(+)